MVRITVQLKNMIGLYLLFWLKLTLFLLPYVVVLVKVWKFTLPYMDGIDGGSFDDLNINSTIKWWLLNTFVSMIRLDISNAFIPCCQALSIYQSLNLSLSLRDRDRADTIITLYHTTPHHHSKLFKYLRVDLYSSVIHHWNRQLKPYSFPLRKNRVN